jgi:hypothetical protein
MQSVRLSRATCTISASCITPNRDRRTSKWHLEGNPDQGHLKLLGRLRRVGASVLTRSDKCRLRDVQNEFGLDRSATVRRIRPPSDGQLRSQEAPPGSLLEHVPHAPGISNIAGVGGLHAQDSVKVDQLHALTDFGSLSRSRRLVRGKKFLALRPNSPGLRGTQILPLVASLRAGDED